MVTTGRARGDFNRYGFPLGILMLAPNMPPHAREIQRATALTVLDIVSLVTLAHGALLAGLPPRPA